MEQHGITFSNGSVDVAATTAVGVHSFDITAKVSGDNNEATATKKVTITVNKKLLKPVLTVSGTPTDALTRGSNVSITVTAASADSVTWTNSGDLPAGVTGSGSGLTFTITGNIGTTAEAKTYTYTVTAKNADSEDLTASETITITVKNTPGEESVTAAPGEISVGRDSATGNAVISRQTVFKTTDSNTIILSVDSLFSGSPLFAWLSPEL